MPNEPSGEQSSKMVGNPTFKDPLGNSVLKQPWGTQHPKASGNPMLNETGNPMLNSSGNPMLKDIREPKSPKNRRGNQCSKMVGNPTLQRPLREPNA